MLDGGVEALHALVFHLFLRLLSLTGRRATNWKAKGEEGVRKARKIVCVVFVLRGPSFGNSGGSSSRSDWPHHRPPLPKDTSLSFFIPSLSPSLPWSLSWSWSWLRDQLVSWVLFVFILGQRDEKKDEDTK